MSTLKVLTNSDQLQEIIRGLDRIYSKKKSMGSALSFFRLIKNINRLTV